MTSEAYVCTTPHGSSLSEASEPRGAGAGTHCSPSQSSSWNATIWERTATRLIRAL